VTRLWTGHYRPVERSRSCRKDFFVTSKPAVRPTLSPVRLIPNDISLEVMRSGPLVTPPSCVDAKNMCIYTSTAPVHPNSVAQCSKSESRLSHSPTVTVKPFVLDGRVNSSHPDIAPLLFTADCGALSKVAVNRKTVQWRFVFVDLHGREVRVALYRGGALSGWRSIGVGL